MENFYKELELQFDIDDSFGIPIPYNSLCKNIGVNLSGGADSALLTFMLCEIIDKNNLKTKISAVTFIRNWKTKPWQEYISKEVFNWLLSRYPSIIDQRITTFIPPQLEDCENPNLINGWSGDRIIVNEFNNYLTQTGKLDFIYNATTQNPPITEGMSFREPKEVYDLEDFFDEVRKTVHPFVNITKDKLYKIYQSYGLEELFNITRSCEISFNTIQDNVNIENYSPGMLVPTCMDIPNIERTCWWCKERQWATNTYLREKGYENESR